MRRAQQRYQQAMRDCGLRIPTADERAVRSFYGLPESQRCGRCGARLLRIESRAEIVCSQLCEPEVSKW